MKKFLLIFAIMFIMGNAKILFAKSIENEILIKTIDNSEAIELFKEKISDDWGMLGRNGFGSNSKIGTPFSKEYQSSGDYIYIFYFPIIRDGEIVNYVEQSVWQDGTIGWAVGMLFDFDNENVKLNDGNIYSIIEDKNENLLAVSDNKAITLIAYHDIDYDIPYEGKETKVVNIMEPIDIDTSFIIPQTEEERAIFENARKNRKRLIQKNVDSFGAINKNDRLLVPLRDIAELIGCTVDWDNNTKAAYAKKDDNIVKFVIGRTEYSVNDKIYNLDVPAEIYNDKTFIPLRAVSEALGVDIAYNSASRNITLSY